jgi:hypothetical protein
MSLLLIENAVHVAALLAAVVRPPSSARRATPALSSGRLSISAGDVCSVFTYILATTVGKACKLLLSRL